MNDDEWFAINVQADTWFRDNHYSTYLLWLEGNEEAGYLRKIVRDAYLDGAKSIIEKDEDNE